MNFWNQINQKLSKTRNNFSSRIKETFSRSTDKISQEQLEELEEILLLADLGPDLTDYLISEIKNENPQDGLTKLQQQLTDILKVDAAEDVLSPTSDKPKVILIAGVNGTGKTTSAAKIAYLLTEQDNKVMLAAADTFRAAGIEQLENWAKKYDFDLIKGQYGGDAAAVVHDSYDAAHSRNADYLIIDTAGRLHTKKNLMNEFNKIQKVLNNKNCHRCHNLLVLDATVGLNGLQQVQIFNQYIPVHGLIVTKLDGTAKGGCVFPVVHHMKIPVQFIGVGEGIEDFQFFDPEKFVRGLFN
ncbi:MAG: signal recognition particle-docking protein FtsY [bacterium]